MRNQNSSPRSSRAGCTLPIAWAILIPFVQNLANTAEQQVLDLPVLASVPEPLVILLTAAFTGACIGLIQWLFLKAFHIRAETFIIATAAGSGVGALIGRMMAPLFPSTPLYYGSLLVIPGVTIALAQTLILRSYVRRAGLWIAANAVAFLAGLTLILLPSFRVLPDTTGFLIASFGPEIIWVIAGIAVVWLMRDPLQPYVPLDLSHATSEAASLSQ